jgi:outer membrane protein assembly factor BamB
VAALIRGGVTLLSALRLARPGYRVLIGALTAGALMAGCSTGSPPAAAGSPAGTASPVTQPRPGRSPAARPVSTPGPVQGQSSYAPPPVGYAPWPETERDATHSSTAPVQGPQTGHLRWKRRLGHAGAGGPSIGPGGTIYESTAAGVLHAISPVNGRDLWVFNGQGRTGYFPTTAAVLPDGTIVWPGPRHKVFGLSPHGQLRWAVNVGGVPLSPVVAAPDQFYVMTMSGVLSAIDVDRRRAGARWSIKLGRFSFGSPVIRDDGVIETTVDHRLVAVSDDGTAARELWQYAVPRAVEVSPAVGSSGITVLGTDDGFEYGISPAGRKLWTHPTHTKSFSSPAVTANGVTYYGDNFGALRIASAASGAVLRTLNAHPGDDKAADNIWTSPLIDSAGDVYYGTNGGRIYGYSATGKQLFAIATGATVASYPAMSARGDLLIGTANGYLYAIGH